MSINRREVEIRLNGDSQELREGATVTDLLAQMGVTGRRVAVELNREILAREHFDATILRAGDVVEVVHFVGGG